MFGPPGTAKTTTAESVAAALGFGFVVIDTAVFLEDGLANIASRMAYVFDRLERLRDCVISVSYTHLTLPTILLV